MDHAKVVSDYDNIREGLGLRKQILKDLSTFVNADSRAHEVEDQSSVEIVLTRKTQPRNPPLENDTAVSELIENVERSLLMIARNSIGTWYHELLNSLTFAGPRRDYACECLWSSIVAYAHKKIDRITPNLRLTFNNHEDSLADLITRHCGVFDLGDRQSPHDNGLEDIILELEKLSRKANFERKVMASLLIRCFEVAKESTILYTHLERLAGDSHFATELCKSMLILSIPGRLYQTLRAAAISLPSFKNVTVHVLPVTIPAGNHTKVTSFPTRTSPLTPRSSPAAQPESSQGGIQSVPQVRPEAVNYESGSMMHMVQKYLSADDRNRGFARLEPPAKRDTVQLVGTILRGMILPAHADAWYRFGFVSTADEEEERHLAGLYRAIITEATDPKKIFSDVLNSLESNKLIQLFDDHIYGHFREAFPQLEEFLATRPSQRPTVWRLRQFVLCGDAIEPPPCLRRDYGFQFCKNHQDVARLKEYYKTILKHIDYMAVHDACMSNRLHEIAVSAGVQFISTDKRFMQNEGPSPIIGFDNELGLGSLHKPLFRKALKV